MAYDYSCTDYRRPTPEEVEQFEQSRRREREREHEREQLRAEFRAESRIAIEEMRRTLLAESKIAAAPPPPPVVKPPSPPKPPEPKPPTFETLIDEAVAVARVSIRAQLVETVEKFKARMTPPKSDETVR
jgi:hypothetical protein